MSSLADELGLWELGGVDSDGTGLGEWTAEPPTNQLGPAVTVFWAMYDATPGLPGEEPQVIQTLYPLAEGGPLVHTVEGQQLHPEAVTVGGWTRAPESVIDTLAGAGVVAGDPPSRGFVVPEAPDAAVKPAAAPGGRPVSAEDPTATADPWWRANALGAGALLAAVAGGVAGAVLTHRRRRRALTVPG
jgi:hypothetical protein